MQRKIRHFCLFTTLILGLVEVAALADEAEQIEVKTQVKLHIRSLVNQGTNEVLVIDSTIPAGSVVSVPVDAFNSAQRYNFWNKNFTDADEFVEGVKLISAPGFDEQDVSQVNSASGGKKGLFLAKSYLGQSIVIDNQAGRASVQVNQPMPVMRSESFPKEPTLDTSAGDDLVEEVDRTNRTLHSAGTASAFCPGCEQGMYKKWLEAGVPEKALGEALEEERKNPEGKIRNKRYLTIVDFTKPSADRRMFILDTKTGRIEKLYTSVSYRSDAGSGKGGHFGNSANSNLTPPGFHVTGHRGSNKHHSDFLVMDGLESRNSNSAPRGILIHGAWYVNDNFVKEHGRTGHSNGCLAIDEKVLRRVLDELQGGSLIYNYTGK